jgi:hypothetical protein
MNIEKIIREELNLPVSDDLSIYKDFQNREYYAPKIAEIVNAHVPKINHPYDQNLFNEIKETGYAVVENFLSQDEINKIIKFTQNIKGYQFHVPNRAFNNKPEFFSDDLDWNICSYKMNHLLKNHFILKMITGGIEGCTSWSSTTFVLFNLID